MLAVTSVNPFVLVLLCVFASLSATFLIQFLSLSLRVGTTVSQTNHRQSGLLKATFLPAFFPLLPVLPPVYTLPAPPQQPPLQAPCRPILKTELRCRLCAPKELKLSTGKAVKWKNLIALREKPSLFICKFLGHASPPLHAPPLQLPLSLSRSLSLSVLSPTRLLGSENIRLDFNTHTYTYTRIQCM